MTIIIRVAAITRDCVPTFTPQIPDGAIYKKSEEFKELLYTKRTRFISICIQSLVINGEKVAHATSLLRDKLVRTKAALLQDVIETFCD